MKFRLFLILSALCIGVFGGAASVRARDREECSERVRKDQRDLDRAIDEHGYYSSQARHERAELQRDAARCGYWGDDDDRWRDNREPYGDRRYDNYDLRDYRSPAFDIGYRDGLAVGQLDRERGKAYRPEKNDYYEDADRGYQRAFGEKGFYKSQYRDAFLQGYAEGYGYRR